MHEATRIYLLASWLSAVRSGSAALAMAQSKADEPQLQRGVQYLEQQKYEQAVRELRQAVQVSPKSYPALYNLGLAYWNLRKLDAAFDAFQQASRLEPREPNSRYYLGRIYLAKGEAAASHPAFRRLGSEPGFTHWPTSTTSWDWPT